MSKGMVTFQHMGRAGNFLCQAAAAYGYARRHGMKLHVPQETHDNFWNPVYLSHLAQPDFDRALATIPINERVHEYQELPFQEEWRNSNIRLIGYWQSEKYWKEYSSDVLDLFGFTWAMKPGVVAIHIRRGDYVDLPMKHPVVTNEYLSKSINYFVERGYTSFSVFSDGMGWAKANVNSEVYPGCTFEYNEKKPNALDNMQLGSCCEHLISSNGTYGLWMGLLNRNPNKIILCPHDDNWFGPENKYLNAFDIQPSEWIRIPFKPIYELSGEEQLILNNKHGQ